LQAVRFGNPGEPEQSGTQLLLRLQRAVWDVHVDSTLEEYLLRIIAATRSHPDLALGASPRASLALLKAAQALAAASGRDHVLPDDIKYLAPFTLTHRLIIRSEAELRGRSAGSVLRDILSQTPLPLDENSQ
jgi:MoxR-like ATPase